MKNVSRLLVFSTYAITSVAIAQSAPAENSSSASDANSDNAQLAVKLSNPVASLISVPLQFNYDSSIGPDRDGHKNYLNIQPVIPFEINDDWNMISRTILPVVSQSDTLPGSGSQHGIGDITQSFFFSRRTPGANGLIWALGPVILLPTASDALLGSKKWGAGPTGLLLRQSKGWTYGVLVNQIWSFASVSGKYSDRPPLSSMFVQPFLSYTTPTAWTYGVNLESTYDWHAHEATVPLNLSVSKLTRLGRQPISFAGGVHYWLASNDSGPHGWGYRFTVTLLFPQK
jgi:hypothetical protein